MVNYGAPVTDKNLLSQLESGNSQKYGSPINDPELLKQLNSSNESFGTSLGMALPRIGFDISNAISQFVPKIPQYISKGISEASSIPSLMSEHPVHALKQAAAGLPELGQDLFNLPANIENYRVNRLNLPPMSLKGKMEVARPPDITGKINEIFGKPEYPGEELLRGIVRNAPLVPGITKLSPTGILATRKGIEKTLIKPHDILENKAIKGFEDVSREVKNRNFVLNPLPNSITTTLPDYFPKTKIVNKLLNKAQTGDYDSLRKIQSELYTRGKKNLSSDLETDRLRGEEMMDVRDDVNKHISDELRNNNHVDLADKLDVARNDFRTLQENYYNKDLSPSLIKMFNSDLRKYPDNLIKLLSERSNPMKQLKGIHPGLESKVKGYQRRENIVEALKKIGIPVSGVALGTYGYNKLNNQ